MSPQDSRKKRGGVVQYVKTMIIPNQFESTQRQWASSAIAEVETIEHFLTSRVSFRDEEIEDSFLYQQVPAKLFTFHMALYRVIIRFTERDESLHLLGEGQRGEIGLVGFTEVAQLNSLLHTPLSRSLHSKVHRFFDTIGANVDEVVKRNFCPKDPQINVTPELASFSCC